jgi:hypothetical protein
MSETIMILTTGSTIDKQYFDPLRKYKIADTTVAGILRVAQVAAHTYASEVPNSIHYDGSRMSAASSEIVPR